MEAAGNLVFHAEVHEEDDGMLWAEVKELPGCFASGADLDELKEALTEAIGMCLAPGDLAALTSNPDEARVDELVLALS